MDVNLIIDGKKVTTKKGTTILEAAREVGIKIPSLCHFQMKDIGYTNDCASCRVCVVEVDKREGLFPACSTKVVEGMDVVTNTPEIIHVRKSVLELILSNHPKDCLVCSKSGECELQDLANQFKVKKIRFEGEMSSFEPEYSPSIIRDMDKCIMCRRCETMCNKIQTCGVLSAINRGFESVVSTAHESDLSDTNCTYCGQCVAVCPVGALHERDYTWDVFEALKDKGKKKIVQIAPAVRVAVGEEFGFEAGVNVEKKLVTALKKLGFDKVFDTNWAADLTIMEEASEFKERLEGYLGGNKDVKLPLLTSCCPAWVKFIEHNYPDMLDIPSTAKSPQQMFSAVAKNIWTKELGIEREDLIVVSIMPCLAKKYEASREEFSKDGNPDTDISISTRELVDMLKEANIDLATLEDSEFDRPYGDYTGAGVIFGRTGGVIEAATRTVYEWITGEELKEVKFEALRGFEGFKSAEVPVGDVKVKIGIAHGLGEARQMLDRIKNGDEFYHAIEIMACKGGCVGGGGQPYHHGNMEKIRMRAEGLNSIDDSKEIRKSHENPYIKELYKRYLDKPLSEKAHKLLHTCYYSKELI